MLGLSHLYLQFVKQKRFFQPCFPSTSSALAGYFPKGTYLQVMFLSTYFFQRNSKYFFQRRSRYFCQGSSKFFFQRRSKFFFQRSSKYFFKHCQRHKRTEDESQLLFIKWYWLCYKFVVMGLIYINRFSKKISFGNQKEQRGPLSESF